MKVTHKLLLAAALPATLAWAVGFYAASVAENSLRQAIEQTSLTCASGVMDEIDRVIHDRIIEWVAYVRSPVMKQALQTSNRQFEQLEDREQYIDEQDREWRATPAGTLSPFMKPLTHNEVAEDLRLRLAKLEQVNGYPVFAEVFITNRYGANVGQTNRTSDYRQNDEDWWRSAMRDGLYVGDVGFDESANVFSTDICVRIDERSGTPLGILKAVLNIQQVINIVDARSIGLASGGHQSLILFTGDNQIIHGAGMAESPLANGSRYFDGVELPRQERAATVQRCDPTSGNQLLSTYVTSQGCGDFEGLGWVLMLEYEANDVFQPVDDLRNNIRLIAAGATLLALGFAGAIALSMSWRIKRLTGATAAFAKGDFDATVRVTGTDELAQLGAGFNRMARDRKQAEERLRESEERHRAITESAQDAVITADATGNIRLWNAAAEKIFGFTAAEVVGKNMMGLIVPPQYHEVKRKGLAEFGRTGHGAAIDKTLVLTALRKDGTEFPIEISLSGYKSAGSFMAVALVRDITERKQAEQELAKAYAESKQLVEAITLALIGVDADDRVIAWNTTAERMFGIETKDAVGQLFDDLGIGWDHGAVASAITECRAKNRLTRLDELRFKPTEGTEGVLSITVSSLSIDRDKSASVLLAAADISEQKILQGKLTQAQKLESIGQLAAGIAHEINTPIQYVGDNIRFLADSIKDLLQLIAFYRGLAFGNGTGAGEVNIVEKAATLEEEADLPYLEEELPKAVEQGLDGVARVSKIVLAMKGFAHPGSEEKGAVDLNQAIETTITISRNEWKYIAEMETELDPALPLVPCLVDEFNQVILNLIVNAAHAIAGVVGDGAAGKGTITISTHRDGNWAEVRIRDTGTGIPEEHRSKVFDHFFTTKEVGKGTGQGLAIAYSVITDKHGGTITFETETGKGTTFIIRMPIELESAAAEETPQHEEAYSLR